jgi:2-dehydro-3-deoxyphosphogalactonate aldolase
MQAESRAVAPRLIAILRGLAPERAAEVGAALYEAGIREVEVPLNSPEPYRSIATLASRTGWTVGAGTVLSAADVGRAREAGARLIVAPNCEPVVIRRALGLGLEVMPGIATATEAFSAITAGARHLKLFPAASYGPRHLEALRAVLPPDVRVYPVGGIGTADLAPWLAAGAAGFGLGSELYRPGYTVEEIARRARALVCALAGSVPAKDTGA